MSRIGLKPVPIPKGVKDSLGAEGELSGPGEVSFEGPHGAVSVPVPRGISIRRADGRIEIARQGDRFAALHGLTRALAANAVRGVSEGWTKELDIVGIGYRAEAKGQFATFHLGYSHPIEVMLPPGITLTVDKQNHIVIKGRDRQAVGQVAANIRALRPPDPYKNKGIRYTGEALRKKVGKAGAGGK